MKLRTLLWTIVYGLLTVIVCLLIADGLIGVEGTIENYRELPDGSYEYMLNVTNRTGLIVFNVGLFLLPILFAAKVRPLYTFIHLPMFIAAWYILSAIFGSHANHRYLDHPGRGFITIGEEFYSITTTLYLWAVQLAVLCAVRLVIYIVKKCINKAKSKQV